MASKDAGLLGQRRCGPGQQRWTWLLVASPPVASPAAVAVPTERSIIVNLIAHTGFNETSTILDIGSSTRTGFTSTLNTLQEAACMMLYKLNHSRNNVQQNTSWTSAKQLHYAMQMKSSTGTSSLIIFCWDSMEESRLPILVFQDKILVYYLIKHMLEQRGILHLKYYMRTHTIRGLIFGC